MSPREPEVTTDLSTNGLESTAGRVERRIPARVFQVDSGASINSPEVPRERSGHTTELLLFSAFFSRNEQSVGRWSGPLPMASGLVKRAVDRGDIFFVIESNVYVANASWSGIRQDVREYWLLLGWLIASFSK